MWACITGFPVVILLTVSFHIYMCLYSRYTFPVHVRLICMPLGFIICTRWVAFWQSWILMSRSQSLDHGVISIADQSTQRILPWRSERSRSLDIVVAFPLSCSPDWLSRSLLLLVSTSQLLLCISICKLYFCIFWWYNIPVILSHTLW